MGVKDVSLESAINAHIKSIPLVKAEIGERVFQDNADRGTPRPYIVWRLLDEIPYKHLLGESSMRDVKFEIAVLANSQDMASEIAENIRVWMVGVHQVMGAGSDTISIRDCFMTTRRPMKIPMEDGSQRFVFGRSSEFLMTIDQPVPVIA